MDIRLGLTFDDVLLLPGESEVLPSQADTRTQLTREHRAEHPDRVVGDGYGDRSRRWRSSMAQLGGIGVLHRNLTLEEQVAAVRQVKRFESGMVVNPITIRPDATLGDAQALMAQHSISGIPVTEADGRLVGIMTNRDVRFAGDPRQPVAELMTHENLVTVGVGVTQEEARRLLHQRRIEKLLVVDEAYRCVGLVTVKDIEKAVTYPNATKDAAGRLRVAAATTVGDKGFERSEALIDGEVRPDRHRHRARPQQGRRARGRAGEAPVEQRPGRRRQHRHRRSRQGADRGGRGRDQGRDRPGLDLHHPRRRRASACRS